MGIARKLLLSGCTLVLLAAGGEAASRGGSVCAKPGEYSAMQVIAVQQELMDAALTCGAEARDGYNRFQTDYRASLKKYDKVMLLMFKRLMGRKGDAAYNLFKTDLATKAEFRRIQHSPNFCAAAAVKVRSALDPTAPSLEEFAAGAAIEDFTWPFEDCSVLEARAAMPDVMPRPNPVRPPAPDPIAQPVVILPAITGILPPAARLTFTPPGSQPEKRKKSGWIW